MLRRSRLALGAGLAALLAVAAVASPAAEAVFAGRFVWTSDATDFGGFSGLELSADGARFVAVGDRGMVVEGYLRREGGRIVSVSRGRIVALKGPDGAPLQAANRDAEGLARAPDGRLFISFEGAHRIAALDPATGTTLPLPGAPGFATLGLNAGLEALAADADAALYAVPEKSGALTRPFPVWRLDGDGWRVAARLPRQGGFLAVGADIGPDGRFYLLERGFNGIGFRSRVRRFRMQGDRFGPAETLFETTTGTHDNLEAIKVWRAPDGGLKLTLLSDDNRSPLQRTEFVEYRLTE